MLHTQVPRPVAFALITLFALAHFTAAFIPLVGIVALLPIAFNPKITSFERKSAIGSMLVYSVGVFFAPVALAYGFISGICGLIAYTALPPKEYYRLKQLSLD